MTNIQSLIDAAANEFFARHRDRAHETRAFLVHDDDSRENFLLNSGPKITDSVHTFQQAEELADATGVSKSYVFHYAHEQGQKLVLISVLADDERAILAFGIEGHTGDVLKDLTLLTGTDTLTFSRPSHWAGREARIAIEIAPWGYGHA